MSCKLTGEVVAVVSVVLFATALAVSVNFDNRCNKGE